jgi:tetratricopeptide (TPR) repeat protein
MKSKDQDKVPEKVKTEMRELSGSILEELSPKNAWPSRFSIVLEPSPDIRNKAKDLLERLRKIKKSTDRFPFSLELDEGIALIALGDYREGMHLIEKYLARTEEGWEKNLEKRDQGKYLAWKICGDAEYYQTHYERAIGWYKDALKIKPDNYRILNSIGLCSYWLRKYADATSYFRQALDIEAQKNRDHSNGYATCLHNLGMVFVSLGEHTLAMANLLEALKIDKEILEENHPDITRDLNNLGITLKLQGDMAGAMSNFQKALDIDKAIYGEFHPVVARDHSNIAHLQCSLDKNEDGLPHIIAAYKINYQYFGPEHPNTKNSRYGIELCGGDPAIIEQEIRVEMQKGKEKS